MLLSLDIICIYSYMIYGMKKSAYTVICVTGSNKVIKLRQSSVFILLQVLEILRK